MWRFLLPLFLGCGVLLGAPAPPHRDRHLVLEEITWQVFRAGKWREVKFLKGGVYRASDSYGDYYGNWSYRNKNLTMGDSGPWQLTHDPFYKECWMDVRGRSYFYMRKMPCSQP